MFESIRVVNKIQIHAPLELSLLRRAAPLELSPHRLLLVLTGPLLMFLTVVLTAVVLQGACHPPLPTLLLMLLTLLYLHTAPHPASLEHSTSPLLTSPLLTSPLLTLHPRQPFQSYFY